MAAGEGPGVSGEAGNALVPSLGAGMVSVLTFCNALRGTLMILQFPGCVVILLPHKIKDNHKNKMILSKTEKDPCMCNI